MLDMRYIVLYSEISHLFSFISIQNVVANQKLNGQLITNDIKTQATFYRTNSDSHKTPYFKFRLI